MKRQFVRDCSDFVLSIAHSNWMIDGDADFQAPTILSSAQQPCRKVYQFRDFQRHQLG